MNTHLTSKDDAELGDHIRRTLFAVADTIDLDTNAVDTHALQPVDAVPHQPTSVTRRLSGRNIAIAAALAILSLGVLGWKALSEGDIERIPTEAALVTGIAEGYEWWLIPSEAIGRTNPCGVAVPGVEMVSAATNRPGEQWNTGGVSYGERDPVGTHTPTSDDGLSGVFTYDCTDPRSDFNEAAWLTDPTLHDVGFTRLGRSDDAGSPWSAFAALHPSIDAIDVIVDDQVVETVTTVAKADEPNGARYAGFTIASNVCTFELHYLDAAQTITIDQRTLC